MIELLVAFRWMDPITPPVFLKWALLIGETKPGRAEQALALGRRGRAARIEFRAAAAHPSLPFMALPLRAEHSVRVFYLGGRCRWIRLFLGNHRGSDASLQRSVQQRL